MNSVSEVPPGEDPADSSLRDRIQSRLWRAARFDEYRRLGRCGERRVIYCQRCGFSHEMASHCMRRYCPSCSRRRSNALQAVYVPTMLRVRWPLFVTLTIGGGSGWDLADMVGTLRGGFKRMRRHKWFRDHVAGGVASVEIAWADRGWHAHLHCLFDCQWLAVTVKPPRPSHGDRARKRIYRAAQKEVAAAWADAVGVDPSGIFVRRPREDTTREVLKYSVKPASFDDEAMPIGELVDVMKGLKMVSPWGTIRKLRRQVKAELDAARPRLKCDCGDPSWCFE